MSILVYSFWIRRSNPPKVIGHYTAVVWATTTYVGCGVAYYQSTAVRTYRSRNNEIGILKKKFHFPIVSGLANIPLQPILCLQLRAIWKLHRYARVFARTCWICLSFWNCKQRWFMCPCPPKWLNPLQLNMLPYMHWKLNSSLTFYSSLWHSRAKGKYNTRLHLSKFFIKSLYVSECFTFLLTEK